MQEIMQKINVNVSGGIEVNVNLGGQTGQGMEPSPPDTEFEKAKRRLEELTKPEEGKRNVMSDEEDVFETPPKNGVLFHLCDIVMVIHPECGASAMTVGESRAVLDIFEGDEVGCQFPLTDLKMTFKPDAVTSVGGKKYLTGTAVVFYDRKGYSRSLDGEDIYLVKRILDIQCKTISLDGHPVKALPL